MLSDESKIKILAMGPKEIYTYLRGRDDLTISQKTECFKFWLDQNNIEIRPERQDKKNERYINSIHN